MREGALQREGDAHLGEHVAAIGGLKVRADAGPQTVIGRRLPGEDAAGKRILRIRAWVDRDPDTGVGKGPPDVVGQAGAMVEDVVGTKQGLHRLQHRRHRPEKLGQRAQLHATRRLENSCVRAAEQA